jgi:hypothetical protein
VADRVRAEGLADVCVEVDSQGVQCTKQKGTALLRYPSAPLVWLPQQFTAPCRNQTSDSPANIAMGVPDGLRKNIRKSCRCVESVAISITRLLAELQNRQR